MSARRRREVVFVIVEGPSDQTSLEPPLELVFSSADVVVVPVYGDITADPSVTKGNALTAVHKFIERELSSRYLRFDDLRRIVHIIDSDGVFIPDSAVREVPSARETVYNPTGIIAKSRRSIIGRNAHKREVMLRLASSSKIRGVPYAAYYMSCNLEHVLHNRLNCTDEEKRDLAESFALKYGDDVDSFVSFIACSGFSVQGSHKESWNFIREDLRSLERHTNLGLSFLES